MWPHDLRSNGMPAARVTRVSAASLGMPDHEQRVPAATEPTHTFHRTAGGKKSDILDNRNNVGRQTNGQR
eukprot:5243844-Prymnesium_polylepis.1